MIVLADQKIHIFDVQGIFGLGQKAIERVACVRGKGRDFESAVLAAHKYRARLLLDGIATSGSWRWYIFRQPAKL